MRNQRVILATGLLAAAAAGAWANDDENRLFNPGFELANPGMPSLPQGWNGINVGADEWVDVNDPGAFVRSGSKAIRLDPAANAGQAFQGWTTNLFLPDGSDLYDPDYEYLGGDVHVTGWYLVPEGEELRDTVVGIKLEFRREPPNFSIWGAFEFALPQNATGGQWMFFDFVVTDEMIQGVGDFPPHPTSVTVLPFRFYGGDFSPGTEPLGRVFLDDLCVIQGDTGGPCNDADFSEPYGTLDFFDVQAFLNAFSAMDPAADINDDNLWDFFDVQDYLNAFSAGCP